MSTMWGNNTTPAAQLARLDSLTPRELGRLLHGSDTCTETKAEIVKRLRAANRRRATPPVTRPSSLP